MHRLTLQSAVLFASAALATSLAYGGSLSAPQVQLAQNFNEPPAVIPGVGPGAGPSASGGDRQPASSEASDPASLLVRIDRLEDQVRKLNGAIQQLQYGQQQLQDALQKFARSVEFRFREAAGGGAAAAGGSSPAPVGGRSRAHDAFEPSLRPGAPGAPRPLGQLASGEPDSGSAAVPAPAAANGSGSGLGSGNSDAPLDLGGDSDATPPAPPPAAAGRDGGSDSIGSQIAGIGPAPNSFVAGTPPGNTREDFDLALVSFNNGQFKAAEAGFRGFLQRHPSDRLDADAVYYLGESYWNQGKTRAAAEQYLKVSTSYAGSAHAPDALLKLGLSLEKLGSREQACASWEQIKLKYPKALPAIRASVARDLKRNHC